MPDKAAFKAIYVGVRLLTNGKLADGFVLQDASEQEASLFNRDRKSVPRVVGGVYEMHGVVENNSIKSVAVREGTFLGRLSGKGELVVGWEAANEAAKQRDRERKLAERLKKEPRLAQEIATLKRVYRRLPFGDRTAFELMVLGELKRS